MGRNRIQGLRRDWRGLKKIEQVELQSMVMWHTVPWIFLVSWCLLPVGLSLRHDVAAQLVGWTLIAVAAMQCGQLNRMLRRLLDHYLGHAEQPRRELAVLLGLTFVGLGLALVLQRVDGVDGGLIGFTALFLITPYAQALAFAVPVPSFFRRVAALGGLLVGGFIAVGVRGGQLFGLAGLVVLGALIALLTSRCGAWTLAVMWEAERGRETESRLAVAEERLRFGRDLHDVMGRNLAVIALKSELAVRLARRGRPEAVDQMVEVQRIAQETQREIREVVRGYRAAELGAELAGARGVLEAAGITCRVTGTPVGLPTAVQAALGWVVREGTTNVLRHGNAQHCAITVSVTEGRTELTIENDGVPAGAEDAGGAGGAGGADAGGVMAFGGDAGGGAASGAVAAGVTRGAGEAVGTGGAIWADRAVRADGAGRGGGGGGTGLNGLRERLATVGGTLEHTSSEGRFRLTARVPLPEGAAGGRGGDEHRGESEHRGRSGPRDGHGHRDESQHRDGHGHRGESEHRGGGRHQDESERRDGRLAADGVPVSEARAS